MCASRRLVQIRLGNPTTEQLRFKSEVQQNDMSLKRPDAAAHFARATVARKAMAGQAAIAQLIPPVFQIVFGMVPSFRYLRME